MYARDWRVCCCGIDGGRGRLRYRGSVCDGMRCDGAVRGMGLDGLWVGE